MSVKMAVGHDVALSADLPVCKIGRIVTGPPGTEGGFQMRLEPGP